MPQRLRSDFWVSAYLRRYMARGMSTVLRRRGAAEAGAVFVKIDHLDGTASLYAPAPQSLAGEYGLERRFERALSNRPSFEIEERMRREISFDSDLWMIEIETQAEGHGLDLIESEK